MTRKKACLRKKSLRQAFSFFPLKTALEAGKVYFIVILPLPFGFS